MKLFDELVKLVHLLNRKMCASYLAGPEISESDELQCSWEYNGYEFSYKLRPHEAEVYEVSVYISSSEREEKYELLWSEDSKESLTETILLGFLMIMMDYHGLVNKEDNV